MIWKANYDVSNSTSTQFGRVHFLEADDREQALQCLAGVVEREHPGMHLTRIIIEKSTEPARAQWLLLRERQAGWVEAAKTASAERGML